MSNQSDQMISKIEQRIDEIEDYIDSCKYQPLSKINIIVNKEEIDELLTELRTTTPEEINKARGIIRQKEEILNKATERAQKMYTDAAAKTTQMVNESDIMKQAYAQANEVVSLAAEQAQTILDNAAKEARSVRDAAMEYLDDMLGHLDKIMLSSMNTTTAYYEEFMKSMGEYQAIVSSNRAELHPEVDIIDQVTGMNNQTPPVQTVQREASPVTGLKDNAPKE